MLKTTLPFGTSTKHFALGAGGGENDIEDEDAALDCPSWKASALCAPSCWAGKARATIESSKMAIPSDLIM
jgi:hypothetical protein